MSESLEERVLSPEHKRFIKLGWELIEAKYLYYQLPEHCELSDAEYDKLELEYKNLATLLNLEPTAFEMVGFDSERPSAQSAMYKVQVRLGMIKVRKRRKRK